MAPLQARTMRIREPGDADVLEPGTLTVRDPGFGELRIAVAAAGLNRADTLQRRGVYPAPPGVPPDVPGLEFAGTVECVGEGVSSYSVGDRVMGIVAGGAMATHLVTHSREVMRVPEGMSLSDAAAVPEVFLTAYDAMFSRGRLRSGEIVLVHAAGSGVGTAAVQLARVCGARSIGTARSAAKLERARGLGMDEGVVPEGGQFADAVMSLTRGRGVDVVVDGVGGEYVSEALRCVAVGGRVVLLGLLGGLTSEVPLRALLNRRAELIGSVLRARPLEEKAALAQEFARTMLRHFSSGALRPVVDAALPMSELAEAHRRMESDASFGKIVLVW